MSENSKDNCLLYINQGSDVYRQRLMQIAGKLSSSAEVIEKIKIQYLIVNLFVNLRLTIKNIWYLATFLRTSRLRNVFFDGLRLQNKQNSSFYRFLYVCYYFMIANYLASRTNSQERTWIILPDEAYGNSLIACLCSNPNCIILTNFTDTKSNKLPYCTVLTYSSPLRYKYTDRKLFNFDKTPQSNLHEQWVTEFFARLKRQNNKSRTDWVGDLSRANNLNVTLDPPMKADPKSALVCGHILADFPADRNWAYDSFEAWLFDLLHELKKQFSIVHYKPHPATERYAGEAERLSKLYEHTAFRDVQILPIDKSVNLKSYSAIFSANGSILIEASIIGAAAYSSAYGATCLLPNVNYVYDIRKIKLSSSQKIKKPLDFTQFSLNLFYYYCNEFQNIREIDHWVQNLIEIHECKSKRDKSYQYCDIGDLSVGLIPVDG